ncbi:hypothetical protein AOCH_007457 [Aspergillus ochraceoroseus]|uniref:Uncharacterized protein n=1 Tax=Aspergillus ochraceoroseus TaxID=138278 RepID=A0A0F8VJ37_9EURO|nr:hypothetical protein AOCH_007457 [Aspergillus ochraceoroseus]
MPIPTRSGSLRLREPRKQPTPVGRSIANTPVSTPTRATDDTTQNTENPSGRNRSLLPVHDGRSTATTTTTQLPQRASTIVQNPLSKQPQEQPPVQTSTALPTRRQSLMRLAQLKTPSSMKPSPVSTTVKRTAIPRGPPSPLKKDDVSKKNDMPPPLRPTRSASLRQPASSSAGTPTAAKGHARHRSQVATVTPASSQGVRKAEPPQLTPTPTTPRLRTQFSTYQQHYSPKKTTAKPPTPVPAASGSSDVASSLIPSSWPEIAALQTELLQLSLLHESSLRQNTAWETGAEAQLRSKYDLVAADYRGILGAENESQRKVNGQALQYWLKNAHERNGQQGFAEQIQLLSRVAQEVYDLSDGLGGRYAVVVLEFENWFQRVEELRNARLLQVGGLGPVVFIDPLDHAWKEEVNTLIMKLELASRQLQSLDILGYREEELLGSSALLRTAKGLDEMTRLMVEELNAIRKIEIDTVKSEEMWVSQLAQQLTAPRQQQDEKVPRTGMWRRPLLKS